LIAVGHELAVACSDCGASLVGWLVYEEHEGWLRENIILALVPLWLLALGLLITWILAGFRQH
jgi:hypothetical protein